jgi:hypothetical protein
MTLGSLNFAKTPMLDAVYGPDVDDSDDRD